MAKVTEAHIEARHNQILDAAWQCFARQGYHRATMQDVAAEAGISAGAIYRYFPGKEAVLKAIVDRNTERWGDLVASVRAEVRDPGDALQTLGQAMFLQFDDPTLDLHLRHDIELRGEALRNDALRESFRQQLVLWRSAMTGIVKEAQQLGRVRPDIDAEAFIVLAICAYEGLRQWKLFDPGMFRPKDVYELLMALTAPQPPAPAGHPVPSPVRPRNKRSKV